MFAVISGVARASRSLVTARRWCVSGVKTVVRMAAAVIAYTVENLLGGVA